MIAGAIAVLSRAGDDHSTAPVDQSPTTTFVSPRHGYSVQYPDGAVVTPATNFFWDPRIAEDVRQGQRPTVNDGVDVVETASGAVFTGGSLEDPGGFPNDAWASIDDYIDDYVLDGGCGAPRSQQAEISIDGQSGKIAECSNEIVATVVAGGRIYGFTLLHGGGDARADFDAFADTIRLTPETADAIPPLETTFVSPTYGYSFGYLDRGGLAPATELWDPVNEVDDMQFDDSFDAVETGLGAYFDPRRQRSRMGSRSMTGSTSTSRPTGAVGRAASKRRSPSTGSREGSSSVRPTLARSWRPSLPAGGSISSACSTSARTTPGSSSTGGSLRST